MASIGVIGAGSWGTALAVLLHNNGHQVTIWSCIQEEVQLLNENRMHTSKLPGVVLADEIAITGDLEQTLCEKDVLVMAVPSAFVRSTCKQVAPFIQPGQIIVDVAKGVEETSLCTMTEVIRQEIPAANAAILSGPSHAEEVGRGLPTTCVVGAETEDTAKYLQNIFMSPVFRVYISPDMLGMELGGSLKNVIALAAGMADGLGYGDNIKAALITRGIREISRLATCMGAKMQTLYGLSGMGDLIVTCASMHSRNRRAGILIGQGKTMEEAVEEVHMVVEGIVSAKAALQLAEKYQVEMPIVAQVNRVLFDHLPVREAVDNLMMRDLIAE